MQMTDLEHLLRGVERSVFRLETLAHYAAPGEEHMLRAFHAGQPLPPRGPDTDPWLRMVADSVESGRHWSRVHVLDRPLSDYLRFELLGYHGNLAAGEDVRIADRASAPEVLGAMTRDYWLLDDVLAVMIEYDENGTRTAMEPTYDVTAATALAAQRDLAVRYSVPLQEFLPVVRDELRRSW